MKTKLCSILVGLSISLATFGQDITFTNTIIPGPSVGPTTNEILPQTSSIIWQTNIINITNSGVTPPFLTGPLMDILKFASTGTNWMFAGFGTMSLGGDHKYGAGVAGMYKLNDFVAPMLRIDYYDGKIFMPSASVNLQAPVTLFGKITAIPFGFTGLATPFNRGGNNDATIQAIFGAGMAIQVAKKFDVVFDIEKWSGFKGEQLRFGAIYKF